jgi:hypothetical protein
MTCRHDPHPQRYENPACRAAEQPCHGRPGRAETLRTKVWHRPGQAHSNRPRATRQYIDVNALPRPATDRHLAASAA